MAIASTASSAQSIAPSVMQTLQFQQAQRTADQARQNARALQAQAEQAQAAADQADQQAKSIGNDAQRARVVASQADQNLISAQTGRQVQGLIAQLSQNVHQAVQTLQKPAPVVNTQGQVTGTVVSVQA